MKLRPNATLGPWGCQPLLTERHIRTSIPPMTPIVVEWLDAYMDVDETGRPASLRAYTKSDQCLRTIGWFAKVEQGWLVVAFDHYHAMPEPELRGTYKIRLRDITAITTLEAGRKVEKRKRPHRT